MNRSASTRLARDRRARQSEIAEPPQPVGPVVDQLATERAREPIALPLHVVAVPGRQRLEDGPAPREIRVVQLLELRSQHTSGPSIEDDVVHRDHEDVFVVGQDHENGPEQPAAREIEPPLHVAREHLLRHCGSIAVRCAPQIDCGEPDPRGGAAAHPHRPSVSDNESRAQHVVAPNDFHEAVFQRLTIQGVLEPHGDRQARGALHER